MYISSAALLSSTTAARARCGHLCGCVCFEKNLSRKALSAASPSGVAAVARGRCAATPGISSNRMELGAPHSVASHKSSSVQHRKTHREVSASMRNGGALCLHSVFGMSKKTCKDFMIREWSCFLRSSFVWNRSARRVACDFHGRSYGKMCSLPPLCLRGRQCSAPPR